MSPKQSEEHPLPSAGPRFLRNPHVEARRGFPRTPILLLAFALTITGSCQKTETRFDILAFGSPRNPERFTERFEPGSFSFGAGGNWDIVFETTGGPIDAHSAAESPGNPTTAPSDLRPAEGVLVSQYIHIEVFWRPLPGTTYAESSQTNASILYCLSMADDVISYEGAGFVYFRKSRDGKTIKGAIESASLVPVRTVNEPIDLFGPCQLKGTFVAREDRRHVVSVLQELRRSLGRPVAIPGTAAIGSR